MDKNPWHIGAFYKFAPLKDRSKKQAAIKDVCAAHGLMGTTLLAEEGLNGTMAAPTKEGLEAFLNVLKSIEGFEDLEVKYSKAPSQPFRKCRIRLKKEIVALKQPVADPTKQVGTYVGPEEWNALLDDPEMIVIDTRNTYETGVGMFEGAVDPKTENFYEFAEYVDKHLKPEHHKKVAMYCTGGIRCEKASSYMLAKGFETVYHLKGGILKYLEDMPQAQSKWNGECFVFDYRVAVGHGVKQGEHNICYGCRMPLGPEDLKSAAYEVGVSCPHCRDDLTDERAAMLRERHNQMQKEKSKAA